MDDEVVIATGWDSIRALYFVRALGTLIEVLECAYCSVAGRVKARYFTVANVGSQPLGMAGESDFHVKIDESVNVAEQGNVDGGNGEVVRDG